MPQSLSCVLVHLVFSTKNREPLIREEWEPDLYRYLAGICENLGCHPIEIGGTEDHVHVACSLSRTIAIAKLIKEVKGGSSRWLKNEGPGPATFACSSLPSASGCESWFLMGQVLVWRHGLQKFAEVR